jgi:hypothetical protein
MLTTILEKINEKGWNLYEAASDETRDDVIPRGPAESLEYGKQYIIYPSDEDSKNIEKISAKSIYLSDKGITPCFRKRGSLIAMVLLAFREHHVLMRGAEDLEIPYHQFIKNLDTLKKNRIT